MITIVIIEDDEIIAEGLKHSIQFNRKFSVVNIYNSAESALENVKNDSPDIIILDISLPGKTGIEIIPELKKMLPNCDLLMLTSSDDDDDIFNAFKLGASGYLQKDLDIENLLEALDELISGGSPLSGSVARKVIKSMRVEKADVNLTSQESKILKSIVNGYSQKDISEKIFISISTVKFHSANIYKKLDVNCKAEAIAKAIKYNLV